MKTFLLTLLLLAGMVSFAKEERYSARLNATTYNDAAVAISVEDEKFYEVIAGVPYFEVAGANCFVTLGVEEGITGAYQGAFDITVTFNITGYATPGTPTSLGQVELRIAYDPAAGIPGILLASKRISGYHKIEIDIDEIYDNDLSMIIDDLPLNSYMELELVVDRFYTLDEDAVFETSFDLDHEILSPTNELSFYWDYIAGAEYYELEWVHVNNYKAVGNKTTAQVPFTEREFKFNSTRIRTSAEHYEIPLIFDQGFIVYRLRPVGICDNDDAGTTIDNEVFGKWTSWTTNSNTLLDTRAFVSHFEPYVVTISAEHEPTINWQYQAVYAEEGKKKDIVTYYDGTLRNRQTATKLSSNDKVIVGETIYDSEGRPAVTILPVPTVTGPTPTPDVLGFHPAFNQNTDDLAYSLYDFDVNTTEGTCGVSAPGTLNDLTGAGLYYDDNVPATGNWQDLVPYAGGYPFVQVEYMPDNTGRIKRQSGVGADYLLNGDHATRYFYTQPYQEELDRLFGTNVGYKSRYKKNIVIDANGQASVSYIDPFGRVIATALVGSEPEALIPLANDAAVALSNPANTMVVDLLGKLGAGDADMPNDQNHRFSTGTFGSLEDGLKFSTEQVVYQNSSDLNYKYTLAAGRFEVECGIETFDYPYVFDIDILLENECGVNVYETAVTNHQIGATTDVGNQSYTNDAIGSTGGINAPDLPIGTYSNTKLLTVNGAAAHTLAQEYITAAQEEGCVKTLADFEDLFQSQVDLTGCGITCTTCMESLGEDADAYKEERMLDYDWVSLDGGEQTALLAQFQFEYNVLVEECEDLCGTGISYCETIREQMLLDVSPHGQYGAIMGDMSMSVFNTIHILPHAGSIVHWKSPDGSYINADGTPGRIPVNFVAGQWLPENSVTNPSIDPSTGGHYVLPQELTHLDDFLYAWDPNWAEALLSAHPEFCYLGWCDDEEEGFAYDGDLMSDDYTSEEIDNLMLSITTFDAAANVTELGGADLTDLAALMALDPFFNNPTSFIPGTVEDLFDEYFTFPGPIQIDVWETAIFIVNEGDNFGVIPGGGPPPGDYTINSGNEDEIWNTFKMLYISLKQQLYADWAHQYAVESGCYNGCIGNAAWDPNEYDFADFGSTNPIGPSYDGNIMNEDLPCGFDNAWNFAEKTPRFFGTNAALSDLFGDTPAELVENGNLAGYQSTGTCPLANELMNMLNGLAGEDALDETTYVLNGKPYFGVQLYAGFGGAINTDFSFGVGMVEDLEYDASTGSSDPVLDITVENATPDNACQDLTLTLPTYGAVTPGNLFWDDYGTDWDISSFHSFYFVEQSSPGVYDFQVIAVVEDLITPADGPYEVLISGSTCLMVGQCEVDGETNSPLAGTFGAVEIPCAPYPQANAMLQFFNYMLTDSSTTKYFFEDTYIPDSDVNYLLGGNAFLDWYVSGNFNWDISAGLAPCTIILEETISDDYYEIEFDDLPANLEAFVEIIPLAAPNFKVKMLLADGTYAFTYGTFSFNRVGWDPIEDLGTCGDCVGEEQLLTSAVDQFMVELLTDGDAATIPPLVLEYLGLTAYASTIDVVGPLVVGTQLHFGFDLDGGVVADPSVQEFILYPVDGTSDLEAITIDDYGPLRAQTSDGPHYGRMDLLLTSDAYVEVGVISPVPLANCPCTGQDAPMTCADAYTLYLAELPGTVDAIGSQEDFCALNYQDYLLPFLTLVNNAIDAGYSYTNINDNFGTPFDALTSVDPFTVYVYTQENQQDAFTYEEYVAAVTGDGLDPISPEEWENLANCVQCKRWYSDYLGQEGTAEMNIDEFCGVYPANCQPDPIDFSAWDDDILAYENDCEEQLMNTASLNAIEAYETYIDLVEKEFITNYVNAALASVVETFELEAPDNEYHYTLYYYDQAGNLIRTVPPGGVRRVEDSGQMADIKSKRNDELESAFPEHFFLTSYSYNALNQLEIQRTPDGGTSHFWYDALGRLALSQNEVQAPGDKFSYTLFDELGRITEVGELVADPTLLTAFLLDPVGTLSDETFPVNLAAEINDPGDARYQVTRTYYDEPLISMGGDELNGRNRIGSVTYVDVYPELGDETEYQSAYHYRYDIHGNVAEMQQEIRREPTIAGSGITSTVEYTYDLVSGNVLQVDYNAGRVDEFYHRYEYDADNRITRVFTSEDGYNYISDSKYFYYDHGPLARTEIGHEKVQGNDYAYTVQGWLKSVNGVALDAENIDMGNDAWQNTANLNKYTGTDASGYSLLYFVGDYASRTTGGDDFLGDLPGFVNSDLFNGNITQMATAQLDHDEQLAPLRLNNYGYDQLNRIKYASGYYTGTDPGYNYNYAGIISACFDETFSFDHNGNLLYLARYDETNMLVDDFEYSYYDVANAEVAGSSVISTDGMTNRLAFVDDDALSGYSLGYDLATQTTGNYEYNAIGQLVDDDQEEIETIEWTVTGKVKKITRETGSEKDDLEFVYDPMGNRICKIVKPRPGASLADEEDWVFTYYTYDAGGNAMAVYDKENVLDGGELTETYTLAEQNIYGSARLGLVNRGISFAERISEPVTTGGIYDANGYFKDITEFDNSPAVLDYDANPSDEEFSVGHGYRRYEMSNHLGNVLEVVSDQKYAEVGDAGNYLCFDGTESGSSATISGLLGTDATIEAWIKTDAISGTQYIATHYDPGSQKGMHLYITDGKAYFGGRIGTGTYYTSGASLTTVADGEWHQVVGTVADGVWKIYVDGVWEKTSSTSVSGGFTSMSAKFFVAKPETGSSNFFNGCMKEVSFWSNDKSDGAIASDFDGYTGYTGTETDLARYWKMNLGSGSNLDDETPTDGDINVNTFPTAPDWTSDDYIAFYSPDVISWSDYYAYGSIAPGRNGAEPMENYRYGFQGQEMDDEIKDVEGSSLNYKYRMHDTRIGRFFAVDPMAKAYPELTPYQFAANQPIHGRELEGLENEEYFIPHNGLEEMFFEEATAPATQVIKPSVETAKALYKRAVVDAFKSVYSGDQITAPHLIEHYAYGLAKPYVLSYAEMKEVLPTAGEGNVSVAWSQDQWDQMLAEGQTEMSRTTHVYARKAGTLGNFNMTISGTYDAGTSEFTGQITFSDTYDFDPRDRPWLDELQVTIARNALPGTPFKVSGSLNVKIDPKKPGEIKIYDQDWKYLHTVYGPSEKVGPSYGAAEAEPATGEGSVISNE